MSMGRRLSGLGRFQDKVIWVRCCVIRLDVGHRFHFLLIISESGVIDVLGEQAERPKETEEGCVYPRGHPPMSFLGLEDGVMGLKVKWGFVRRIRWGDVYLGSCVRCGMKLDGGVGHFFSWKIWIFYCRRYLLLVTRTRCKLPS